MSETKPLPPPPERKRGCSPWAMALLGCGGVCLLLLLAVCGGGAYFIRSAYVEANDFATSFEEQGYQRASGQVIDERDQVTSPRVYFAQVARVYSDVSADLAFAVQVAEIHGTVDGDIDFYGQVLVIKPGAVVKGNVRVKWAQVVQIEGTVEGEVSGNYQNLQRQEPPSPPDEPAAEVPEAEVPEAEDPEAEVPSADGGGTEIDVHSIKLDSATL